MLSVHLLLLLLSVWEAPACDLGLPEVDLSQPEAAKNLLEAFQTFGFSYIRGHNVEESLIEKADEQAKLFFKLPSRVKRQVQADRNINVFKTVRGWTDIRQEQLNPLGRPDLKEVLDVGYLNRTSKNQERHKRHYLGENKWPDHSDGKLKNAIDDYAEKNAEVAHVVLKLLSEALVGSGNLFDQTFGSDALQVQRLTKYPASEEISERKEGEIGSGVHTDYGGLTLLHADGPGLAVLKPDRSSESFLSGTFSPELEFPHSEEWLEVEDRPGTLIAMAGEALQRLSHGRILAAKHKVELPPHLERHSLAFFLDPRPDAVLEPLPELLSADRPTYRAKLAGHKGVVRT